MAMPYPWTKGQTGVDIAAHKTRHQDAGLDEISIEGLAGTSVAMSAHVASTADVHTQYQKESEKAVASGYASLSASTLVVENPANATATPTASKIPIADTAGLLNSWVTLPIRTAVTAQFNKTADTALATVPGLSIALAASSSYLLEAILFVDADAVGGHKYALDGAVTANSIKYQVNSISNASNLYVINTRLTALAGTTGQAGATGVYTEIVGVIASSAAGSINVQFAQQAASGTSSVLTQSSFKAVKV